ncbi:MAG: hypothetical protein Q9220_000951 [cf. Caloplaca sp. 1 TL-2023]
MSQQQQQNDFDLALHTKWYTKTPPAFPLPSMVALGPCTSTYSWTFEQDFTGTTKTLICAVRFTSSKNITKVRIVFKASDPSATVVAAEQKHYPPPPAPSEDDLIRASSLYGENLALWVEAAVGTTVGDGECWTLVHTALVDLALTYSANGIEPPLLSQGREHGYLILTLLAASGDDEGSNAGLLSLADVRRGDVIELSNAHFVSVTEAAPKQVKGEFGKWVKGDGVKNVRLSHHTAIVVGVEGDAVEVVEQNGGVPGGVGRGRYGFLEGWRKGRVQVFRVVGEGYGGEMRAEWED